MRKASAYARKMRSQPRQAKSPPHCAAGSTDSKVSNTPTQQPEVLRITGVYLVLQVIDCGGYPILAFTDEQKANEYAAKRSAAYQLERREAVIKNCGYTDAQADVFAESMANQFYVEYVEVKS